MNGPVHVLHFWGFIVKLVSFFKIANSSYSDIALN